MEYGKVGDRIVMESESLHEPARDGVIVEVLGSGEGTHYTVRWEDGHKSTFFPTFGATRIIPTTKDAAMKTA
jgi:hypothetical protein